MKKMIVLSAATLFLSIFFTAASAANVNFPPLDKVTFELQAQQWATSDTAKVTIGLNASLTNEQLSEIHKAIKNDLKTLAPGANWHITEFKRSKSTSDLEQIQAEAVTRLPDASLSNIRAKIKSISKPGKTYKIVSMNFSPSNIEIEKVKADLRETIYKKIQAELKRLNNTFTDESFFLHNVDFYSQELRPSPRAMTTELVVRKKDTSQDSLAVNSKIILRAKIVLASTYHIRPS